MNIIDSRDLTIETLPDGWTAMAIVETEHQLDPAVEFDCYSEEDILAWRNDEWSFVTLVVQIFDSSEQLVADACIGGVENGLIVQGEMWEALNREDLVSDLIAEAMDTIEYRSAAAHNENGGH